MGAEQHAYRRRFLATLSFVGAGWLAASSGLGACAAAESYPSRPVRVIVAAPPGGLTDIVARSASQYLQTRLGQPFVVENMAGANNTLGASYVARAAPDGYTLLVNPSLFVITPMLLKVPYDPVRDFTAISNFGTVPLAVAVNKSMPANTLQEFLALAKANPEHYSWATDGLGSVGHLTMERIQSDAGFKLLIVPYKGTTPALIDLIAGRVSAVVTPVPNVIEYIRSGALKALAVTTKARVDTLPTTPTLAEAGLPHLETASWYGLWGPANTPDAVVSILDKEIAQAMKTPQVVDPLIKQGLIPSGSDAKDFSAFIDSEITKYGRIIQDDNIKLGD